MSLAAVVLAAPLAFGPLQLDMSIAQLQAAAPTAGWEAKQVSPFTQRVFSIRSTQPLEVVGARFNMHAEVGYYHQRWVLVATLPAKDAPACEQAMLGVLAALEPQLGPFSSREPRSIPGKGGNLVWRSQQGPNGIVVMPSMGTGTAGSSSGELVAFGTSSRVLVEAFDDQGQPRARKTLLSRRPPNFDLSAFQRQDGQRVRVDGRFSASLCELQLELNRETPPPAPTVFDAAAARVVYAPSIAEKHLALPDEIAALTAPVEVALSCRINREMGDVNSCDIVGTKPPAAPLTAIMETYAHRLARERAYDTSGVDRDDPQAMVGTLRVKLDPADRRPVDFLEAPRTPLEQVVFTRQPEPPEQPNQPGQVGQVGQPGRVGQLEQAAPVFMLARQHFGTPQDRDIDMVVNAVCRIEADGSLLCGSARLAEPVAGNAPAKPGTHAETPSLSPELRDLAFRTAASRYQVAPQLSDGKPSVGRVIELALRFRNY